MALRDIIKLPDPRLRLVSKTVTAVDDEIRTLIEDMFATMYDAPGIGLAAIQVGVPQRVVTMDSAKKDDPKDPRVFLNPEVLWSSEDKATHEEGCLSIPEYYEEVERPARVRVRYMDLSGETHDIEADELLATCLQHEIDHLNGVLFIDHLSKLKRSMVIKKFTKAAKREAGGRVRDARLRVPSSSWAPPEFRGCRHCAEIVGQRPRVSQACYYPHAGAGRHGRPRPGTARSRRRSSTIGRAASGLPVLHARRRCAPARGRDTDDLPRSRARRSRCR